MSVYKRGATYWFKFRVNGQLVRESAHTDSKSIARDAERTRRRQLEESTNGIVRRQKMPLFKVAAAAWLESKVALTPLGRAYYRQYVGKLISHFGSCLVSDITADDVTALQRKRQSKGLSGRQVNCEIATLRAVLKHYGLWASISHRVKMLRERTDTGRAVSSDDERKLLEAVAQSPSPSLYPFLLLSLDAGLRPAETRALRLSSLQLQWRNGTIAQGEIVVGQSKTEAGTGRVVPLTRRLCAALSLWLSRFPEAGPDAHVFPFHRVGFAGNGRKPHIWNVSLERPMGTYSYKRAFNTARHKVGLDYRLYDARHTFVTRLAESPAISEETIRQLAGHVSHKMLARYAHIRTAARRAAIAALEGTIDEPTQPESDGSAMLN
jgi:integrase